MRRLAFIILVPLVLIGCARQPASQTWSQAMSHKLDDYDAYSRESLTPYFLKADLPYAPKELAFVVLKHSRKFIVYARNHDWSHWRYIKTYPIQAASGGPGPKLEAGDHQVPEGVYGIVGMNPRSRFDLSLELSYPNNFDRQEAAHDHRKGLGGNIFIHGGDRSIGCIALGDDAIEQLFPLVYAVGEHHVMVVIAPDDLRRDLPLPVHESVHWLPTLYARLKATLMAFPLA